MRKLKAKVKPENVYAKYSEIVAFLLRSMPGRRLRKPNLKKRHDPNRTSRKRNKTGSKTAEREKKNRPFGNHLHTKNYTYTQLIRSAHYDVGELYKDCVTDTLKARAPRLIPKSPPVASRVMSKIGL